MSTFAPLQLQNTLRSKVKYFLVGIFLALAASMFLAPGSASAADSYRWADPETIRVTVPALGEQSDIASYGAARGSTVEFKRGEGPHTTESARRYTARVSNANCQATLTLTISADSKGSGSVAASGCTLGGTLPGVGKTVSISNTNAAGDDSTAVPVEEGAGEEEEITCETSPDVTPALRFVACPALEATTSSIWLLDDLVTNLLNYDIRKLEDSAARDAWRSFQIIAYSLVFIAGLVIVIGQAAGVQFLDAYTIKKALPRLIIAVVFIALSWEILLFFVAFMNQLGWWAQDLILEPFGENLKDMNAENAWIGGALNGGVIAGAATGLAGVLVYMTTIGWAGVGLILLSWLIGILIVFAVIAIRTIIITLGIVLAPLAIASMILPATQNLWELWRKAFITASTVFPLITALLAMGKVAGDIMGWPLLPLLYIAPYFLIPAVFKLAGGLIGRIAGMVNDPSRGVFDRLRNTRGEMYKRNKEEYMGGERDRSILGSKTLTRGLGSIHNRNALMHKGGWGLSASSRERYRGALETMDNVRTAEKIKEDAWQSTGDDDATFVAQSATSKKDFVNRYMQHTGKDEAAAMQAMGRLENAFGDMGSNAMQLSTARARLMSPTANTAKSYDAAGRAELHNDVVSTMLDMEEKGMARDTVINTVRSNGARPEHGFGHSDWIRTFEAAKAQRAINRSQGRADAPVVSASLAATMDNYAAEQTDPYNLAKANDRSIRFMAQVETDRLDKMKQDHGIDVQITNNQGQIETVRTLDLKDRAVQQELATTMGRLDVINSQSPQKAKILADVLMRHTVGPTEKSMQIAQEVQNIAAQMSNTRQDDPAYQNLRVQLEDAHKRYDLSTTVREVARTVFDGSSAQYGDAQQIRREYGGGIRANDISSNDPNVVAALRAQEEMRRRQEEEQQG